MLHLKNLKLLGFKLTVNATLELTEHYKSVNIKYLGIFCIEDCPSSHYFNIDCNHYCTC